MNKKLIILAVVLMIASMAFGQIRHVTAVDAAVGVGRVVQAGGAVADIAVARTAPAAGIITFKQSDTEALIVSSGIVNFASGEAAGTRLTYDATGNLVAVDESDAAASNIYQPIVAISLGEKIMVTINMDKAVSTEYFADNFLGLVDNNVRTVKAALDEIDSYLGDITGTYRHTIAISPADEVNIGDATPVDLVENIQTAVGEVFAEGDDLYFTFTGEFDDGNGFNYALIEVSFAASEEAVVGNPQEIHLMNLDFLSKQSVTIIGQVTVGAAVGEYSVVASGHASYNSGRFISGTLTVEKF